MGAKIEGDARRNFNVFCMCTLGRHRRDFGQVDNSEVRAENNSELIPQARKIEFESCK